jgi:hypothetical protein
MILLHPIYMNPFPRCGGTPHGRVGSEGKETATDDQQEDGKKWETHQNASVVSGHGMIPAASVVYQYRIPCVALVLQQVQAVIDAVGRQLAATPLASLRERFLLAKRTDSFGVTRALVYRVTLTPTR